MAKTNLKTNSRRSISGAGVGLRADHFQTILAHKPNIPWFEILADNYLVAGGPALFHLDQISEHYPFAMHSVGMSIGSTDPLNMGYLNRLKALKQRIHPAIISDHLCWISVNDEYCHELFPLPYTQETIDHVVARIAQLQDFFDQQILIENVSSYLTYQCSEMTEWEFLSTIAEAADCLILLDINNIYVSSHNHHFNPIDYLNAIPASRVAQFHLAGFTNMETYYLDSHGDKVCPQVWQLYQRALERFGPVPTLVEWDNNIPDFSELQSQASKAQQLLETL